MRVTRRIVVGVAVALALAISAPPRAWAVVDFNFGPCNIDVINEPQPSGNSIYASSAVHCTQNVDGLSLEICIEFNPAAAAPGPPLSCSTSGPHTSPRDVEDASTSTFPCVPGYYTTYSQWMADQGYGEKHSSSVFIGCREP